jgi:peptidyl-prolyl cis-trans isomerase SurA
MNNSARNLLCTLPVRRNKTMKKLALAIVVASIGISASAADIVQGIVVRVGDRIITRTQYEKRLNDMYAEISQSAPPEKVAALKEEAKKGLIDDMIGELLIKDRADRLALTVSDAELKDAVGRLKTQYNITTDEQFDASLKQSGMTRADMEARMRETLISNKVFAHELRRREEATDAELRDRYNREKERFRLPERARLREIVILKDDSGNSAERAQRAADLAEAAKRPGADFANLASTMSEASGHEKGGDLGEVAKGDLVPELDTAVFNAPAGSVIGPIDTKSAWHIIKVEQRLPSEVPAFETIKDTLRHDASEETFQRDYKAYIEQLRKDAYVQINEEMIPKG